MLTTTYNQERFVGDCIRSVQAQTFTEYEHIIVDDGSIDGTAGVVRNLMDDRTFFIPRSHVGIQRLSEIYNAGLKKARGEFIAVLEGDDMFPRRKLELQYNSMKDDEAVLSFGKAAIVNSEHKLLGVSPSPERFRNVTDWLTPLIVYDYIVSLTAMIRHDALLRVGGFTQPPDSAYVDYSTYLELALIGKFKFIDELLGVWVKHGHNYSDANLYTNIHNKYSIEFCRKHNIPIPWDALNKQKGRDYFHIGRHQLLAGNMKEARRCFSESFKLSPLIGKAKAIGGLAFTFAHLDLENIAKSFNRPTER